MIKRRAQGLPTGGALPSGSRELPDGPFCFDGGARKTVGREWEESSRPEGVLIGKVAKQLGVSSRAIRLYQEAGLIDPARDDRGRRVFGRQERFQLEIIVLLRDADIPLKEIATVLRTLGGSQGKAVALNLVRGLRQVLQEELARLDELEARIAASRG